MLSIWRANLVDAVLEPEGPRNDAGARPGTGAGPAPKMPISEAQLAEVVEMLHDINDIFVEFYGTNHMACADVVSSPHPTRPHPNSSLPHPIPSHRLQNPPLS